MRGLLVALDGRAYLRAPVSFPASELELFFDIEIDPMRDVCYLHGLVECRGGDSFFGDEPVPETEEQALSAA